MTKQEHLAKYGHSGTFVGTNDDERLAHLTGATFTALTAYTTEITEDSDGTKYVATGVNINGLRVKRTMRVTDDGYMWRFAEGMVA